MKKVFCFIMLIAMFSTVLIGCKPGVTEESNESLDDITSTISKDGYTDENGKYVSSLEVKDWEGRNFNILLMGPKAGTYQSEDFTTESVLYGDLLNDAVAQRNAKIEETYNVKIVPIRSDTVDADIRNDVTADTGAFDAVMPYLPACAKYAQEGYLYDLTELENIDLSAPWWDQNANEAFSVGNKLYFTTGDITILNKVCTPSILFNKAMIDDYNLDNPYELVNKNEWTFDKMVEMAKAITTVNVPEDPTSKENTYGMLAAYGNALQFYGGAGETLCGKDADDKPYLTIGSEKSISVAQKILSTLQEGNWVVNHEDFPDKNWDTSFATFLEGRALFRPSAFSATTKARQRSEIEFGILPTPLFDEAQEDYKSYSGTGQIAGLAIPISCPDIDFSSYMVEVCAAEAKNTITPAYYDVNLKYRDARDDESVEMLDIIFDNIVYDVGEVYNFGKVRGLLGDLMTNNSTNIASELEAIQSAVQTEIDQTIANYEDN
ncbi:MAG: hypothetical protein A2Y15_08115 [Clostridiales bacterium GWF2_36_10]|nr:MAG: hypothetical protein A2Y15_08115 [Clostridiales bacterium GWF2_36_10]